ncbi:MAG: hypothetical protein K6F61_02210 [Clostridiales bacterium]|nr:hypothetical protein [Clostridiales bacterium]
MKKILATLLALAMILALVPAVMAEGAEPITVRVFIGANADQPTDDNKIRKMIEEELGIKFEFEFLGGGNLDEKLNLINSDEDNLPDLYDGSNSAETLVNAGVLIDLLPYITEEGTPNLWKHLHGTNAKLDQLLSDDGKLFIIPNYGIYYNHEIKRQNGPAFFLQKQVIAWNDYKIPKTLNEYFDLIERFMAANPKNEDGVDYIGFHILCNSWHFFCLINPVQHLMGRPNDGEVLIDINDPEYHTETFINQPYAKPYYKKLNEEFRKGVIIPDSMTMSEDQYIADLSSGIVLGMFDQNWAFNNATAALLNDGKYANTYLAMPLVYDPEYVDGKEIEEHYINGTVMNKDRGFGISINCKFPERMIQMFETLLSDEWQIRLQWGIEGEDWYTDENGRMNMTAEQVAQRNDSAWVRANKLDAIWGSCPKKEGVMDNGNAWDPTKQDEIYNASVLTEYDKEFQKAAGMNSWEDAFNPPIELAPYGEAWQIDKAEIDVDYETWKKIQEEWLPKCIMASEDKFDETWDAFIEAINPTSKIYTDFMQEQVLRLVYPERYK